MSRTATAFKGATRLASGTVSEVAIAVHGADTETTILVFDDVTGHVIDLDLRGTPETIAARYTPAAPMKANPRGRPKLGVIPREVTLLPRHWDWLATQSGGASVGLRKLVEAARKSDLAKNPTRNARHAAYRFMSTMAGDMPGFEEATRAFFASDQQRFEELSSGWPEDINRHIRKLLSGENS